MVPLVGNICTIFDAFVTNDVIGNGISANGKNVTNQWYHWRPPERPLFFAERDDDHFKRYSYATY